jgi:hypothetical protein
VALVFAFVAALDAVVADDEALDADVEAALACDVAVEALEEAALAEEAAADADAAVFVSREEREIHVPVLVSEVVISPMSRTRPDAT